MYNNWNSIFINIGIGMLAFVSIFYSFIVKREIHNTRDTILKDEWQKYLSEIKENLEIIIKESNSKQKPNFKLMSERNSKISEILESMTLSEDEIDINKHLFFSVIFYLLSIIMVGVDSISNFSLNLNGYYLYYRTIGYFLLGWGLLNTLLLIFAWHSIIKNIPANKLEKDLE